MENIFLKEGNKKECTGCGACALACPVNAINMIEDEEGFKYPIIDESKCIKCNKCKNTCSNYNDSDNKENVYIAINKNEDELLKSTSGGMFSIISNYVLNKDGVIFGVELDSNLNVKHSYAENLKDCQKFHGSKYVQSDLNGMYQKAKEFLEDDRYVLFTGTPCQCQGLKVYLGKDYEKLILCDIVCHSNPSPKVLKKYISEIEKQKNKKVVNVKFRNKNKGWQYGKTDIFFDDGTEISDTLLKRGFDSGLTNRPSCSECKFSGTDRITDFTIGDLWGIENIKEDIDKSKGVSLLSVNSEKGNKIFETIKDEMLTYEIDKELAYAKNHHEPLKMHKNRARFFENIDDKSVIQSLNNELKQSLVIRILRRIKRTVVKLKLKNNL